MLTNKAIQKIFQDYPVTGLAVNSQVVKAGNLFFALCPEKHEYIQQAIQQGAVMIFCEKQAGLMDHIDHEFKKYSVPIVYINNLRQKIGKFATVFYRQPSANLNIIAVTGTNGKTSCTHFIAQALTMAGYSSAVIGTLGHGKPDNLQAVPASHTTPDAIDLQRLLAEYAQEKLQFVALEASSHGLHQGRLNHIAINTGIFTNLTRDHLDYHHSMYRYAQAKYKLFTRFKLKQAILNLDDAYGVLWAKKLRKKKPDLTIYGLTTNLQTANLFKKSGVQLIFADQVQATPTGLRAELYTPWGSQSFYTALWGKFNLSNLLSALVVLCLNHCPFSQALLYLSQLTMPMGRMQLFKSLDRADIIIDYAHTPDALGKTLQAIREHCRPTGKIWCIFGCGGNRDKGKRADMGRIAEQRADNIILTNDNPRTESPDSIIADICCGISKKHAVVIQPDRKKAIIHAITYAKKIDIILIAGKGHEAYQEIGTQKMAYSDITTVKALLSSDAV